MSIKLLSPVAYNPNKHHCRSIRLKGHDYSDSGTYFITICTYQREQMFGAIVDGIMQWNCGADRCIYLPTVRLQCRLQAGLLS